MIDASVVVACPVVLATSVVKSSVAMVVSESDSRIVCVVSIVVCSVIEVAIVVVTSMAIEVSDVGVEELLVVSAVEYS